VQAPSCPDHGTLVLDLARGRLDDADAAAAEQVRDSCPICSAWWRDTLEGERAVAVDNAVAETLASFRPPERARAFAWLAVAAGVTVLVGAALVWQIVSGPPDGSTHPVELVGQLFEGGDEGPRDLTGDGEIDASDLVASLLVAAETR